MVGLNKACTYAAARFPARRRLGIITHLHYNYFENATYAYTIYVQQTYAWSVSTRFVLTRLPVLSLSTTEDQNAFALQLSSECHLSLQNPTVLPFCFPLKVVVLPPVEHTGFSLMILSNHCLCNAIPAN